MTDEQYSFAERNGFIADVCEVCGKFKVVQWSKPIQTFGMSEPVYVVINQICVGPHIKS